MDIQLFAEEKREQPTQRRREEARERGQVVRSQEIGVLVTLFAGAIALRMFGPSMAKNITELFTKLWAEPLGPITERSVRSLFFHVGLQTVWILAPVIGSVAVVGLLAELAQVGFVFTSSSITMDLNRIDPFEGLKRLFSRRAAVDLLKSLLKFAVVAISLTQVIRKVSLELAGLMVTPLRSTVAWAASVAWDMVVRCAGGLLIIAAADYLFQWKEHERSLMMSRQEIIEELKQSEGRPEMRQRIRQRQRQMASARMMDAVKTADVVVVNPTHFAVALKYDTDMAAPQIVAKGKGWLALRIKEEAAGHDVSIVHNVSVARALYYSAEVGESIPPSLYQAVAEILAFVYKLKTAGN